MRDESTTSLPPLTIRNGVLVLTGYGICVAVERKHLVVSDGVCDERRQGRFSKAIDRIRRLVIIGHSGTVTLEALRWLHDVDAAFVQIDADGRLIVATGPARHPGPHLLRAQALATTNGTGIEIARNLLRDKVRGHATILRSLIDTEPVMQSITQALDALEHAKTFDGLRIIEAEAGAAYWKAWDSVSIKFARCDLRRIPGHWRTFGIRHSPLTSSPRNAVNPANALLNYLYAILESEARIAVSAVGLDPALGILHADLRYRDSLACDLMEPVRLASRRLSSICCKPAPLELAISSRIVMGYVGSYPRSRNSSPQPHLRGPTPWRPLRNA
jgi:CRISPR-associated endonuclease Cas1